MMKTLRNLAILAALAVAAGWASAQTSITATKVVDSTGALMATGKLCFASSTSSCNTTGYFQTVTNGKITGGTATFTPSGGATLFIYNSSNAIVFQYPASGTFTPGTPFNFDTFLIPTNTTANVVGNPRGACNVGAIEIRIDLSPTVTYTCASVNGQNTWSGGGSGGSIGAPSGQYSGNGVPAFQCVSPCSYVRTDGTANIGGQPNGTIVGTLYVLPVTMGTTSNAWMATTSTLQLSTALNYWAGLMFSQYNPAELRRITVHGHYVVPAGQHPTLSSCGSWSMQGYSSDQLITVTGSPGITSCTINFRAPQAQHPMCTASPVLQSAGVIGTPVSGSASSQTFTFSSSQTGFTAHCVGTRY